MLTFLLLWLWLLFLAVLGAAIWFGWWKSWTVLPIYASQAPGIPWGSLAFLIAGGGAAAKKVGVDVPLIVIQALVMPCLVLFFTVALFGKPEWALPPWYREWKREQQQREGDGPPW